ncbi:hypothetical protein F5Y18DRAFT_429823 [Xylariaceae sp. FL1019]|nr:hypothetical protein F5Y18DRAFT_429823 [Xylariaceae sp. FL1019]
MKPRKRVEAVGAGHTSISVRATTNVGLNSLMPPNSQAPEGFGLSPGPCNSDASSCTATSLAGSQHHAETMQRPCCRRRPPGKASVRVWPLAGSSNNSTSHTLDACAVAAASRIPAAKRAISFANNKLMNLVIIAPMNLSIMYTTSASQASSSLLSSSAQTSDSSRRPSNVIMHPPVPKKMKKKKTHSTDPYLRDSTLVAEAVRRAQMALVQRDMEDVSISPP